MQTLSILVVDEEPTIRKTLSISLEAEGHRVRAVSNTKDALSEANRSHFDLALVDLRLGAESGLPCPLGGAPPDLLFPAEPSRAARLYG